MAAFNDWCAVNATPGLDCLPFGTNVSDLDPERLVHPFEGVNFTGCNEDATASDLDGDGKVSNVEYGTFLSKTAGRRCISWPNQNFDQRLNFISLACQCASHVTNQGSRPNCCVGKNAHVPTNGASDATTRTAPQDVFLRNVCVVTYETLPGTNCSIKVLPAGSPPGIVSIAPDTRTGANSTGSRWTLVAAMIAGLLLLLLICCCCCVVRRRRRKEYEEQEVICTEYPGEEEYIETPLQEQAPRAMNPPPSPPPKEPTPEPSPVPSPEPSESDYSGEGDDRGGRHSDEEMSSGEGNPRRGGNYLAEEEEDNKRRWPGGGIANEEKDKEKNALKPIPAKESVPPDEWDEPGRHIEEIKPEPDEMSAQEFERYDPGGGVDIPERAQKAPVKWDNKWEKGKKPEDDEYDSRKQRIQTGHGEGEIWDKLDNDSQSKSTVAGQGGDAFDWVVQNAMNVMDNADEQGHLDGDEESTVTPSVT